jgi:hypothetical protein
MRKIITNTISNPAAYSVISRGKLGFSAIWLPYNQSTTLRNLLDLARKMGRAAQMAGIPPSSK